MPQKPTYDELVNRVHELEQVEKELLRSEQRYRFLIEATTSIDWKTDASGGFVDPQSSWEKFTGQPWDEHKGFGWTKMIHPDDVDRILQVWKEACETGSLCETWGQVWSAELEEYRDVEVRAVPIMDTDGTLSEWVGFIMDVTDQKKSETALIESELRLRQLAENLREVFWVGTPDWNEVYYISPAYESIWGLTCQSLYERPRSWIDSIVDEDRLPTISMIPDHIEDMTEIIFPHYRIRRPDGTIRWISARAFPISDESGNVYRVVGIAEDVTQRKQSEKELANEFKLRTNLLDNIPDCIALIVRKHTQEIVAANKYAYDAGAVLGKKCFETCFSLDSTCPFCKASDLWETGEQQRSVFKHQGAWYESVWMDLSDDLFVHYIFDITDRKDAEKALIESEARLKRTIQKSPLPMVVTDEHQHIQFLNEKFTQLFGYTLDDLETMEQWWDIAFPDPVYRKTVRQAWETEFEKARTDKSDTQIQKWDVTIKSGAKRNCEFHMVVLGDLGLIVIQDITDKQRNEERLRQAQKMESIGNLAGGIAHDFNNILSPIIGMSEMLMEDLPPDSLEYDNAFEIYLAGKRGSALVKQILSFSRRSEHKKMPVQLQHIVSEVLKLSRSTIPANTEIVQDIQSDGCQVMADPTQLHQIAMNLITNAHHAVELEGGRITVQLKEVVLAEEDLGNTLLEPGRYALLSVADDGHGMSADVMANIFEPYYTTKEMEKGTGLGLAVAYGLVKEHSGEIIVTSRVGEGTTFTVYLPLLGKKKTIEQEKAAIGEIAGTERILLVDDEAPIVKLERQIFERLGYQVTTCQDSIQALEQFKADPDAFDMVITDMAMPNMTGDQLTRELLAIRPDLPIIICTGFSERISPEIARALGARGFIMKPIVRSELVKMVRSVLDAS